MTTIQQIQSRVEKEFESLYSDDRCKGYDCSCCYFKDAQKEWFASQIPLLAQETYKAVRTEEKCIKMMYHTADIQMLSSTRIAEIRNEGYNQALKDLDANYSSLMGEGK